MPQLLKPFFLKTVHVGGHYKEISRMAQVTEFCKRLMVSADVSNKALEYHRLSELKCPRGSISSSCMAIVCIELAASQLGDLLDKVGGCVR